MSSNDDLLKSIEARGNAMTNAELQAKLEVMGFTCGPVTDNNRSSYIDKFVGAMKEGLVGCELPTQQEDTASTSQVDLSQEGEVVTEEWLNKPLEKCPGEMTREELAEWYKRKQRAFPGMYPDLKEPLKTHKERYGDTFAPKKYTDADFADWK